MRCKTRDLREEGRGYKQERGREERCAYVQLSIDEEASYSKTAGHLIIIVITERGKMAGSFFWPDRQTREKTARACSFASTNAEERNEVLSGVQYQTFKEIVP